MTTKNKTISKIVAVTMALSILVTFSATTSAADINVPADYTTIQAAIDAATSGDRINVADGTYNITSRISVNKENITITGNVNHPDNVVVQYNPVVNDLIFDMRASNATVKGIKTTNGKSGFWFDQSGVTGCTVSHCIIDTVNEYGIYMKNGGSGHMIEHNTISNTGQTYAGAPAVLIENSSDVTINENTLSSITDKGIYVRVCAASSTAERVEVTGNILSGCGYSCIQVYQSPYTIVDGNTINSTNDKGINIIGCNANSVAERVEVTSNVVSGCPWDGILVTHDRYTYIHGNTVGPTGDKGITIGNGENVNNADERIEVSGNTVTGTKYPGIQVAWTVPYTYIYDNTLTGCNYYGADGTGDWDYASIHVDANCNNTIVDKNDVSDGINGIQIWADNCEVTNNTIYNMGLTYNDSKVTADEMYYNSGIIIGSNWLITNFKPTGTTITCNSIYGNVYGLYVRDYASLLPSDNSVLCVTAENNWWGDASGPTHSSNSGGIGDTVSDNVDFDPWITMMMYSGTTIFLNTENVILQATFGNSSSPYIGNVSFYIDDVYTDTVTVTISSSGVATLNIGTMPVGVYEIRAVSSCMKTSALIAVYDPTAGFVTGGGWIDSSPGAYYPDTSLAGKAKFGFVSKYKKGADTPIGTTQFKFANFDFRSDSYDWLVIAGARAQYKGTGTINGAGNYGFMLTAIDEALTPSTDVDLFRIKIWDKVSEDIVYDNKPGASDTGDDATILGGGSIVIHKAK